MRFPTIQLRKTSRGGGGGSKQAILWILFFFTSFSAHRPAQRECARTGLRPHARCHPYPILQPIKFGHTTGVYDPYSFRIVPNSSSSFTFHKNKSVKVLWDGTYGFSSLSEKTRKSNHLQIRCHYKGSTFCSVIRGLWVLVRLGFEPATSRPADWRSPNWANQAAVKMQVLLKMVNLFKLFGVFLSQRLTGKENPVFSSNYRVFWEIEG